MLAPARSLLDLSRTPTGRKALKYSTVSAISILVSQGVLFLTFGVLRLATAAECNVIATAVATIPSYNLNRRWAWGKTGKSHPWKEVVPFWTLALIGLVFSTYASSAGVHIARAFGLSHLGASLVVNGSSLTAYGILWVGKFIIFNKILFADRSNQRPGRDDDTPGGAGRGGSVDLSRQSA